MRNSQANWLDCYREIWLVDFEFRQPDGGLPEPHCMVALEFHTGRTSRKQSRPENRWEYQQRDQCSLCCRSHNHGSKGGGVNDLIERMGEGYGFIVERDRLSGKPRFRVRFHRLFSCMSDDFSQWLSDIAAGDDEAVRKLWDTYFKRMVALLPATPDALDIKPQNRYRSASFCGQFPL